MIRREQRAEWPGVSDEPEGFWPGLERAPVGYLDQGTTPAAGLQAVPAKTTNDHDMYPHPVQCSLGTVPTTHGLGGQGTLGLQFV